MDVNFDFFKKLALAMLIGILIGIEREHRRPDKLELIAGVRSFTIVCIAGMISSFLAIKINPGILLISLAFLAGISILFIYIKNVILKTPGITGPIALYCTFLLGVLISYELFIPAVAGAVIITLLLAEKQPLHSFAIKLTDEEILSAVRFLAVVFILYPLTPDTLYLDVINPRTILLIVIFVATISFASFVIMKNMGTEKGIPVSGMLGGLVNSEATTAAFCAIAKKRYELIESSFKGIIMCNATMLIRNLVIALIVDRSGKIFLLMLIPMAFVVIYSAAEVYKSRNNSQVSESIRLQSPFALSPAIKFALGFTGLSIASKFANLWAGAAGVYATALGGFISSAVVTASATALAVNGNVSYSTGAITAILASLVSTGNKMILVKWSGPPKLVGLINKTFTRFIIVGGIVLVIWGLGITYL
ncbi:MAG: MgtC/SapB transporter [Candidatus Methanoperedenaceae archaeon]|nr:MAG: MgtC/SapB transporter [Candidatus Methanoperedenaceae archaeon]